MKPNPKEDRKKFEAALEALMIMEKREGDSEIVVSPKGMSYPQWLLAKDLAMACRILRRDSDEIDLIGVMGLVVAVQEDMSSITTVFPCGPKKALETIENLFSKLKGKGFGPILRETAALVAAR